MTEAEVNIMNQIGEAAIERKSCMDKISCYKARLKTALYGISVLTDEDKNPLHDDNQNLLTHTSDPREDAKGYVETLKRFNDLTDFLKKHNAL